MTEQARLFLRSLTAGKFIGHALAIDNAGNAVARVENLPLDFAARVTEAMYPEAGPVTVRRSVSHYQRKQAAAKPLLGVRQAFRLIEAGVIDFELPAKPVAKPLPILAGQLQKHFNKVSNAVPKTRNASAGGGR